MDQIVVEPDILCESRISPEISQDKVCILFWNVYRKDLRDQVCSLAEETKADVIVLCENSVISHEMLEVLRDKVSTHFFSPSTYMEDKRFHCFCRTQELDIDEYFTDRRIRIFKMIIGNEKILLTIVHGKDILNNKLEHRSKFICKLADKVREIIDETYTERVVILGDFNMNPFDSGVIDVEGFNAMMTRECVFRGVRTYDDQNYDLFYNPMWGHFGDRSKGPAGTYFYTGNQGLYGWNMLDQVLIHHSLVPMFNDVEILTCTGDVSLINSVGHPDRKKYSDHFPILVTFNGGNYD